MARLFIASRRHLTRLAALLVFGLALALVTVSAGGAAGGTTVSIAPKAAVLFFDQEVEVQVTATCTDTVTGTVIVSVTQTAAQSGNGNGGSGSGGASVNCDGSPHKVNVTAFGCCFNIGKATATATLSTTSDSATEMRTIALVNAA